MVRYLLAKNLDVNAQDATGETPLMDAARFGHFGVAELLVKHPKMCLHIRNKEGMTAEQVAREHGYTEVADLIAGPKTE